MRGRPRFSRGLLSALFLIVFPLLAACASGTGTGATGTTASQTSVADATDAPPAATSAAGTSAHETAAPETPGPSGTAADATAGAATTAPMETSVASTAAPAATEAVTATAAAEAQPDRPGFGVVAHLYYNDRDRVLQLAQNAGFEWIRQQVPWKDTENADRTFAWDELDRIVESVNAKGQKLLLSLTKSPDFLTGRKDDNGLPQDPKDFGRFAEEVVKRYKGKVHAIEVWNEQNLAWENGGRVVPEDATRYVELLKEGYTRIKAADPSVIVVAGALSSTGVTEPDKAVDDILYLRQMYAHNGGEIRNYFDAQGFHPASAANHPDRKFPEDPGDAPGWNDHPTHYFRHIEDVRQVMEEAGMTDKKIWITEMGWATENNSPGYEYGNYISQELQAQYLEAALFRTAFQYGDWVGAVFLWNLNFAVEWAESNPLHEQASFGLLNPDWSPRPSFTAVQGFIAAAKANDQP